MSYDNRDSSHFQPIEAVNYIMIISMTYGIYMKQPVERLDKSFSGAFQVISQVRMYFCISHSSRDFERPYLLKNDYLSTSFRTFIFGIIKQIYNSFRSCHWCNVATDPRLNHSFLPSPI